MLDLRVLLRCWPRGDAGAAGLRGDDGPLETLVTLGSRRRWVLGLEEKEEKDGWPAALLGWSLFGCYPEDFLSSEAESSDRVMELLLAK